MFKTSKGTYRFARIDWQSESDKYGNLWDWKAENAVTGETETGTVAANTLVEAIHSLIEWLELECAWDDFRQYEAIDSGDYAVWQKYEAAQ